MVSQIRHSQQFQFSKGLRRQRLSRAMSYLPAAPWPGKAPVTPAMPWAPMGHTPSREREAGTASSPLRKKKGR